MSEEKRREENPSQEDPSEVPSEVPSPPRKRRASRRRTPEDFPGTFGELVSYFRSTQEPLEFQVETLGRGVHFKTEFYKYKRSLEDTMKLLRESPNPSENDLSRAASYSHDLLTMSGWSCQALTINRKTPRRGENYQEPGIVRIQHKSSNPTMEKISQAISDRKEELRREGRLAGEGRGGGEIGGVSSQDPFEAMLEGDSEEGKG